MIRVLLVTCGVCWVLACLRCWTVLYCTVPLPLPWLSSFSFSLSLPHLPACLAVLGHRKVNAESTQDIDSGSYKERTSLALLPAWPTFQTIPINSSRLRTIALLKAPLEETNLCLLFIFILCVANNPLQPPTPRPPPWHKSRPQPSSEKALS
jgi:hypothetical protein